MLSGLDGGCVVAILPESSLSFFAIVDVSRLPSVSPYFRFFGAKKAIIALF